MPKDDPDDGAWMSTKIKVTESISLAGSKYRANEDTYGSNAYCAFVIDGATGLGDCQQLQGEASDAAWLANHAKLHFENSLSENSSVRSVVADWSQKARKTFFERAPQQDIPRFAWPTASFAMLCGTGGKLTFIGLGDSTLLVQSRTGIQALNPLKDFAAVETDYAARHLQKSGGFGQQKNLLSDPETLVTLRRIRNLQNKVESGVWTLGLVPEAADHLHVEELSVEAEGAALLCSDGFSALISDYQKYTSESLLESALASGLQLLMDELRNIETVVDPDASKYPRFKQSDDATAVIVTWSE